MGITEFLPGFDVLCLSSSVARILADTCHLPFSPGAEVQVDGEE